MVRNLVVMACCALAACGVEAQEPEVASAEQAIFDCTSATQRFTCAPSSDPAKRFVCHSTGHGFVKLDVLATSSHVPGEAHGNHPPDQAPGASGLDLGGGSGLDCECNERLCAGTCTGGASGAACDDDNKCTGDGTCLGDVCQVGAPSCAAGAPVDSCTQLSGACEATTGTCLTENLPQGTTCGRDNVCTGAGECVECLTASTCPGTDTVCGARSCSASGACGMDFAPAGTTCGSDFVCDGSGECVGVPRVTINEVESNGGIPGDWIELVNTGTAAADVSGWRVLDNDNAHTAYVIPSGTTIAIRAPPV